MFENFLSIESLIYISVGAIFSFKIGKLNLNLRNDIRNKSPDVRGDNNQIVYNEVMAPVRKEMAFSVKVCAVIMMITFHMYPQFFINLLFSLSFILPLLSLVGFLNSVSINGINRGWDILYPIASFVMGVFSFCSVVMMNNYASLYPELPSIYHSFSGYNVIDWFRFPRQVYELVFIIWSSIACPALIILGFYLAFANTKARSGNDAFRFSVYILIGGYFSYLFLSGELFSPVQSTGENFLLLLTYPFRQLISIFTF